MTNKELIEQSESDVENPVKAIRAYCRGCCMYSDKEVRLCPSKDCALWAFRFGRSPYLGAKVAERLGGKNPFKKEGTSTDSKEVIDISGLLSGDSDLGGE